jgi:DNA-binding HxlR family transcriptional regulator
MANQRKLKDFNPFNCPVAHFMNSVGGKWKIIIIYAISEGVNRFSLLQKAMPLISKQAIVNQLRELETDGLVKRLVFAESPPRTEYVLTGLSESLMPIIMQMEKWGLKDFKRLDIEPNCSFANIENQAG